MKLVVVSGDQHGIAAFGEYLPLVRLVPDIFGNEAVLGSRPEECVCRRNAVFGNRYANVATPFGSHSATGHGSNGGRRAGVTPCRSAIATSECGSSQGQGEQEISAQPAAAGELQTSEGSGVLHRRQ